MPVPTRGMFPQIEKIAEEFAEDQIKKHWAIYHLVPSIVKIVRDTKSGLDVKNSENQSYPPMFLSHNNIERFDTSSDAIEYFCKHYWYPKEKIVQTILEKFPSEKTNLERFIAQAPSKCPWADAHAPLLRDSSQSSPKCTPGAFYGNSEEDWKALREAQRD